MVQDFPNEINENNFMELPYMSIATSNLVRLVLDEMKDYLL
jgi:hypothetical protein